MRHTRPAATMRLIGYAARRPRASARCRLRTLAGNLVQVAAIRDRNGPQPLAAYARYRSLSWWDAFLKPTAVVFRDGMCREAQLRGQYMGGALLSILRRVQDKGRRQQRSTECTTLTNRTRRFKLHVAPRRASGCDAERAQPGWNGEIPGPAGIFVAATAGRAESAGLRSGKNRARAPNPDQRRCCSRVGAGGVRRGPDRNTPQWPSPPGPWRISYR